jgi:heme/copper-type cytochrome/quinol oxidase subunit 1
MIDQVRAQRFGAKNLGWLFGFLALGLAQHEGAVCFALGDVGVVVRAELAIARVTGVGNDGFERFLPIHGVTVIVLMFTFAARFP